MKNEEEVGGIQDGTRDEMDTGRAGTLDGTRHWTGQDTGRETRHWTGQDTGRDTGRDETLDREGQWTGHWTGHWTLDGTRDQMEAMTARTSGQSPRRWP